MTAEHISEQKTIDLFAFTDREVSILSLARQTGKVKDETLDHLCDGGAQLLHGIGKEKYKEKFGRDGFLYSLSIEGDTEMKRLLASTDEEIATMERLVG